MPLTDLKHNVPPPAHLLNREMSWLEFNQRVLEEAIDPNNPLLERVKFFCISNSNLDEFFEVRVAGLQQQVESGVVERSSDGLTATQALRLLNRRVRRMVEEQYACWRDQLRPALASHGIRFLAVDDLPPRDRQWLDSFYRAEVRPVLTPLAIDPSHPFPHILNKSLNMIVRLQMRTAGKTTKHLAVVQAPRVLPRLVKLPRDDGRQDYVFLAHLIGHFLGDLFPGTDIQGGWQFRVTRNSELYIDEDATNLFNLLTGISQFQPMQKLLVAPFELHAKLLSLIDRETDHARRGLPARVIAKMNSLVDERIIEALYLASHAGVKIDLIIRGMCCLRPGVPALSTNITVRSIVDRFLEHSRVWYFENAAQPQVFISSADWMHRNFFRRIEVAFPVEDGAIADRILREILAGSLADNVKARVLQPDGTYRPASSGRGEPARRSQPEFVALAENGGAPTPKGRRRVPPKYPEVRLAPRPAALGERRNGPSRKSSR